MSRGAVSCWSMIFLLASAMAIGRSTPSAVRREITSCKRASCTSMAAMDRSSCAQGYPSPRCTVERLSVLPPSFRPTSATTAPACQSGRPQRGMPMKVEVVHAGIVQRLEHARVEQ